MCLVLSLTDTNQINAFSDGKSQPGVTFRVVGASTTKSRGIRYGEIYEMREAESAIRTVIQRAQKMAGCLIENVFLTFSSGSQKSTLISASIDFIQKEVSETDIGHALSSLNLSYDDLTIVITIVVVMPRTTKFLEKSYLFDNVDENLI